MYALPHFRNKIYYCEIASLCEAICFIAEQNRYSREMFPSSVYIALVPSQYSFDGYNLYNSRLKREFVSIISTLTEY